MSTALMSFPQAEAAAWTVALPAGTARRIAPVGHARWLAVTTGRVWLTVTDDEPGGDVWLAAGEGFALGAGVEAVVEGDGAASFQLVEAVLTTRRVPGRSAWQRAGAVAGSLRRSLQFGVVSAPCAG